MTLAMRCVWSFSVCCTSFLFYSRESLAEFGLITLALVIDVSINRIGCCPTVNKRPAMTQNSVVYSSNIITACKTLWVFHHWNNSRKQITLWSQYAFFSPSTGLLLCSLMGSWHFNLLFCFVMYYLHELIILCENTTVDLKTSPSDRFHPISCFNLSCASHFMKTLNEVIIDFIIYLTLALQLIQGVWFRVQSVLVTRGKSLHTMNW